MAVRLLQILLGGLVAYIVAGWLSPLHPLLEVITNVRAQVVFLALLPLVGFVALKDWRFAAGALAVFVWLAASMLPYWTASVDSLSPGADAFRAMQYNVFFGNEDYDAIADHIIASDAHVVALHELLPEQWTALEPRLADAYPHAIASPLDPADGQAGGGMALLSRTALVPIDMPEDASPADRVILVAKTEIGGEIVTLIGLHPHASRTESRKIELRDAQLDGVVELVQSTPGPAMVLTDLNIAPTSPAYSNFIDDLGWRDPHRVVGWQSSWPTWGGSFGMPIDHIFVSDQFGLHGYQTGSGAGSDHKSVVAELSLPQ